MINKKVHKKKRVINKKRFTLFLLTIFMVIMIFIIIIYNAVNYSIYKRIINNSKMSSINIEYKNDFLILWNKTRDYINDNDKKITFLKKGYSIEYDGITKMPKVVSFNVKIKSKKINIDDGKKVESVCIDLSKEKHLENVKNITISENLGKFNTNVFDVYYNDNGNYKLYGGALEKNNDGNIVINVDKNISKYYLTYTKLDYISVDNENIEINKKQNAKINVELFPHNSTNNQIYYEYDSNSFEISDDGVITPKKAGEYKIKIKVRNETIEKDINLKVDEVVEKVNVDKKSLSMETEDIIKINVTVEPENATENQLKWESDNESVAKVDKEGNVTAKKAGKCKITVSTTQEPIISVKINITVKQKFIAQPPVISTNSELKYVGGVLVVNKKYGLPKDYNPGVNQTALAAFNQMKAEAAKSGFNLRIVSGFRSYSTQDRIYNNYVKQYGQASADTFSARPGNSEHQTGLAFDISSLETSYGETAEGKWLANNCHRFGFIIRYPKGKEEITGYVYEPWHIRYLGNTIAINVFNSGLCLEEYLKID